MSWTQKEIDDTYAQAQKLAATDEAFRAELLSNPRSAIEKLTGKTLPDSYNIKVIESDPNYSATFVLPLIQSGDLSFDALDNVAGGVSACPSDVCGGQTVK